MKEDPSQHSQMPNIVAPAYEVKRSRPPLLGYPKCINHRSDDIHTYTLGDGRVEVERPLIAPRIVQLQHGREARRRERDIEQHAEPTHVCAIEALAPGENAACSAKDDGEGHVDGAAHGFAVEGGPFGREDGGGDEEGDAGVVDAGEAVEEAFVGDAVHGVPHDAAEEAFAGGGEEAGGDEDVPAGGEGVGLRCGIPVEGDGEDE